MVDMKDKDTHLLAEAYNTIKEATSEIVVTPTGTYKVKLIKNREFNELQVRVLRHDGVRFFDLGDDFSYMAGDDKEDALLTLADMAKRIKENPESFNA